jgi:hypothetical protein
VEPILDCKIYPLGPGEQDELDAFLEENLSSGRIRPSQSKITSPFFFIKKKDGRLRLVLLQFFPYPTHHHTPPHYFLHLHRQTHTLIHKSSVTVTRVTSHITLTHITAYIIMTSFMTYIPYL